MPISIWAKKQMWLALWVVSAFIISAEAEPGATNLVLRCSTNRIGKYETIEFTLEGVRGGYANPYDPDEIEVNLSLATPGGAALVVPAFYCQDYERQRVGTDERSKAWIYPKGMPVWKARFAPNDLGAYEARGFVKDLRTTVSSEAVRFVCVPSGNKGFLRVSRRDPRFLEFTEGQPFFPVGQNLAFIGSQQYVTLPRAETIFSKLAENGANYLRIWACCDDWAMAIEARKSAWGRSWDWRAPIVPDEARTNRRCLKLAGGTTLKIEPSHPVALRPRTRFVFTVSAHLEAAAKLQLVSRFVGGERSLLTGPTEGWKTFRCEFETGPEDFWLGEMSFRTEGKGTVWINQVSLQELTGGPELLWEADVNRPSRGFYNPVDCFMLEQVLAAAEQRGLYLQLCLLTRDLYMSALKDPSAPAYDQAVRDAKKLLRYAVARWGASTSIAAWEYWNEMDPGLPTDRFYAELGDYLEQVDVYHHLRTTSTWGPSAKDCRHSKVDLADTHFYLRPSDKGRIEDEVDAVLQRTRWLREQAPTKPAHLGEFGLADEKWRPTAEMNQSRELVDFHNTLWASALSGASGTALFWWWERLDERNGYPIYLPLSRFIADVPWTCGELHPARVDRTDARLRVFGLQAQGTNWLWIFNREAGWQPSVIEKRSPQMITHAQFRLDNVLNGSYRIRWWDTVQGKDIGKKELPPQNQQLLVEIPDFQRDIACQILPAHGLTN